MYRERDIYIYTCIKMISNIVSGAGRDPRGDGRDLHERGHPRELRDFFSLVVLYNTVRYYNTSILLSNILHDPIL